MQALSILRSFLATTPLPSEAQQIDRQLATLATNSISALKPSEFPDGADSLHIFFYSVLMLSTDLHNDKVQVKMTPEQFQRNITGVVNISEKEIRNVYENVKQNPVK